MYLNHPETTLPLHRDPWKKLSCMKLVPGVKKLGTVAIDQASLALLPLRCGQREAPRNYTLGSMQGLLAPIRKSKQNLGAFKAMLSLNSVLLKLKR